MPKFKHHWPTLKAEYIEGITDEEGNRAFVSLEDISQKYGVAGPYLRRVAAKENWLQERHLFVTKVEQARKEKKSATLAGKGAEFDSKCLKVAEVGVSHVARHFQLAAEAKKPVPAGELAQLTQALKNAQQIGRLALGDSTEKIDKPGAQVNTQVNLDLSDCTKEELEFALRLGLKLAGPQEDDIR